MEKNLFWFLVELSYSSQLEYFVENDVYLLFLVIGKDKQFIVTMKKGIMKTIELKTLFKSNKLNAEGYSYRKIYKLK